MALVPLDELAPGMVLASDLIGQGGRVLLRGGSALDDKLLRVLRTSGVTEADIQGVSEDRLDAILARKIGPEALQASRDHQQQRFSQVNLEHEVMRELFRISVQRSAQLIAAGGKLPRRDAADEPASVADPAARPPADPPGRHGQGRPGPRVAARGLRAGQRRHQ